MTTSRDYWQLVYERFDPEDAVRDPAWRADRGYSPADRILEDLSLPFGDAAKRCLFYGTVGSGKSTELYRIAEARAGDSFVVLVDLFQHFSMTMSDLPSLQRIQPWEALLLLGLTVHRAAEDVLGHRWEKQRTNALEQAAAKLVGSPGEGGATIDVPALAAAMSGLAGSAAALATDGGTGGGATVALTALAEVSRAVRWTLPLGSRDRSRVLDQDSRTQGLLTAVNALIDELQARYLRPVTVLVDGLDRIVDAETTRRLFVESDLLSKLACPTILTAPLLLRRRGWTRSVGGFHPYAFANVPVLTQERPELPHEPGLAVCRSVLRKRTADLDPAEKSIDRDIADRLAYRSGGVLRDFVRLVRLLAKRCYLDDVEVATVAHAEAAIDELRRIVEEGLHRGHLELLRGVIEDPSHELPDDERVDELLTSRWLLPYPNESVWWYPHPLLLMRKLT